MGLAQWVRLVPRRFREDIRIVLRTGEDHALLEPDPVGEFLSRKEDDGQSVGEDSGAPAVADPEPQVVGSDNETIEIVKLSPANREQSLDDQEPEAEDLEETPFDGKEERVGQLEDEAEEMAVVAGADPQALEADGQSTDMTEQSLANGEQTLDRQEAEATGLVEPSLDGDEEGVGRVEEEAEVVAAIGNVAPEGLEAESQGGEASDVPQAEESREGDGTDDLLDIFKAEKLEDSPFTALTQGLSDVNIDFLLAETKRIAGRFRKAP